MTEPVKYRDAAEEGRRALKKGSHRDRSGLIVASGALLSALVVLGLWLYAYHGQTYVYARTGQDASWEIIKRGIMLAGFVGMIVALVLTRVLDARENASTKGASSSLER